MWCFLLAFVSLLLLSSIQGGTAEQCGRQAGGALCPGGQCCSKYGWCGTAPDYCSTGCQSQCGSGGGDGDIGSLVSRNTFNQMLKHRNDGGCPAKGFYTYDAFIAAAKSFPNFAKTGDAAAQKREIAAFLAQTSHETTGQNKTLDLIVPGILITRVLLNNHVYLDYGNYNYGQCGKAMRADLLTNANLVPTDPVISLKTALWFWMTPQSPKPSCHDVITRRWNPSGADKSAGPGHYKHH
ncbi:hypothetical protein GBA52_007653 [Prunus armeniaca]|nr:hypothetical protein GBA52_007653 [Prunus armeniaca]